MKHQGKTPDEMLNEAVTALRSEQPESGTAGAAQERVWQRLSSHPQTAITEISAIKGCGDIRALIPLYRAGKLEPARALLVQDHLYECVGCRNAAGLEQRNVQAWSAELPKPRLRSFGWVSAVAAVLVLAAAGYLLVDRYLAVPSGPRATVAAVDGGLYLMRGNVEQLAVVGQPIEEGDRVRTAGLSRAVLRLRDGSQVEMNERAEFGVSAKYRDTTIHLDRGDIIVQAAHRSSGHLYVAARDCRVAVTGTVFAVNSGIKGSRVSVIQGEVRVSHAGETSVLHPGDQLATSAAMQPVPLQQEISWSKDREKHLALLAELAHLQHKLEQVQLPSLRYESKLLPLLPADTVIYAGLPNLGDYLKQANDLFQQELQESAVLREWWNRSQAQKGGPGYQKIMDELHSLSEYVGNEVVFSIAMDGKDGHPLALAQVERSGLKEFLEQEISRYPHGEDADLHVLDEAGLTGAQPSGKREGLWVLVRPDIVAVAADVTTLRQLEASLKQGSGGFGATTFGQRVAGAYREGAGMLFAADLQKVGASRVGSAVQTTNPERRKSGHEVMALMGLADLRYMIAERKDLNGQTQNRAELSFTQQRRGMASWLGAPAPMGGLDFVSKDAGAVAAFVTKSPSKMLDDVFGVATYSDPASQQQIDRAESELNIRFHQDLADTLGGELVFALDGPVLPTPSWKVVAEVYDPARLQNTLQQLLQYMNAHDQNHQVSLESEVSGGVTYYTLRFQDAGKPAEVDYTFSNGYIILAPSRALVMNAVQIHNSGNSISRSADFRALMPQDGQTDVSALVYQNLAPLLGPIAEQLTPEQRQVFGKLAADNKPSLVCAYGEDTDIRVASNSKFFGLDLNTLALTNLLKIVQPEGVRGRPLD